MNLSKNDIRTVSKGCSCAGKKRTVKSGCQSVTVSIPVDKPDLATYSQLEKLQNSEIPDWNSPDILTNNVDPFQLLEHVSVKVRNLSASTPALNAQLHYYTSAFGIGTRRNYQLSQTFNLAPSTEATFLFPIDSETRAGDPRMGVHVEVEHPHDQNLINNKGSQIIDAGYTSDSGRSFHIDIPVLNDSAMGQHIYLSIMPTELTASLSFSDAVFMPNEQRLVRLRIDVPDFLHGLDGEVLLKQVTVVGRLADNTLIGGITRLVYIDN